MPFDHDERGSADDAQSDEAKYNRRAPGEGYPAEAGEQDSRGERDREQDCAGVVDLAAAARNGRGERRCNYEQGEQARRQVDVEDPAPAQVIDEETSEQRADDRGKAERGSEKSLVARAFARRDEIADDGGDVMSARANSTNRTSARAGASK